MSRGLRILALVVILPALHFFLQVGLGVGRWAPDFLTLAVLLVARDVRMSGAALAGFVLGLLEDAFSILSFGANTVALTVVGMVGARSRDLFVGESIVFFAGYLFLGGWLRIMLHWAFSGDAARSGFREVVLVHGTLDALWLTAAGLGLLAITGGFRSDPGRQ